MRSILIVVIAAAVLWLASNGVGVASTTTAIPTNCLQSIQQQYSAQWAQMSQLQRAMVGLRASACEGGK